LDPIDNDENDAQETSRGYIAMRNTLLADLDADADVLSTASTSPVEPSLNYQRVPINGRKWTLKEVFNLTLDNDWDAYWFRGKANAMAEEEFADLMTRQMNLELDPGLAETAGWRVGGESASRN